MFDKFHEECGVVAIYGHPEASKLAYLGLYALQHRGQESAGICTSDGDTIHSHKSMGHVADIFTSRCDPDFARGARHRPHALLDGRRHGAAERAAVFGDLQQGPDRGGAQRQHHQRRGTACGPGAARLHLSGIERYRSDSAPGGALFASARWPARCAMPCCNWKARFRWCSWRRTASSWRAIRTASGRWRWAKWKFRAAAQVLRLRVRDLRVRPDRRGLSARRGARARW